MVQELTEALTVKRDCVEAVFGRAKGLQDVKLARLRQKQAESEAKIIEAVKEMDCKVVAQLKTIVPLGNIDAQSSKKFSYKKLGLCGTND